MAKKKSVNSEDYEYDPIKDQIGGKEAERVVWSTKALNVAIEGIRKGLPLKANPFIGKNTKLLKPDLVYRRTAEEIEDYIKCMKDPVYFASKCFLMTPEGLQQVVLRDYQEDYLRHLQNNRFSIWLACRQAGKTLNMLTMVSVTFDKNNKKYGYLLNKYYFYIKDNSIYITVPIFELYHIYSENSIVNNIRYSCYKLIYKLIVCQELKDKNLKRLKKTIKNIQNIIKNVFRN